MDDKIKQEMNEAESRAWEALGRGQFQMFGSFATIWTMLNNMLPEKNPNPWQKIVRLAKEVRF